MRNTAAWRRLGRVLSVLALAALLFQPAPASAMPTDAEGTVLALLSDAGLCSARQTDDGTPLADPHCPLCTTVTPALLPDGIAAPVPLAQDTCLGAPPPQLQRPLTAGLGFAARAPPAS